MKSSEHLTSQLYFLAHRGDRKDRVAITENKNRIVHFIYNVVRDPSVGTPIRVPSVQIGDLVGASYRKIA